MQGDGPHPSIMDEDDVKRSNPQAKYNDEEKAKAKLSNVLTDFERWG